MLASVSWDRRIRIWRTTDWNAQPVLLRGHIGPIMSVAWSPDGTMLASGSNDKTIRIWRTTDWNAQPVILRGHTDSVNSVAWSPDGSMLASGSNDRTVRITPNIPIQGGGAKHTFNGKMYKIHIGMKGGKYILVGKIKKYV
jgi:WD40 repeat protein